MRRERNRRFVYKKRDPKKTRERARQQGGNFESAFDSTWPVFKVHDGDNTIRILPPTWDDPEHFGIDVWVHYNIGDGTYLCPKKMRAKRCPACEEADKARREGEDDEYVRKLQPTKRCAVLLIDRDKEKEGPMLWVMPWTVDRDINGAAERKKTGEVLPIDDPEEGYDVSFTKTGSKRKTKYSGFQVDTEATPLSDNSKRLAKWLAAAEEKPIPTCLSKHTAEQIENALAGRSKKRRDDDEEDDDRRVRTRGRSRDEDEDEDEPRRKKRGREDEDDEEDDDDEDEPRRKKSKRRDDDEDEIDDEDEDIDDDRPKKKARKRDEDDDEDERPSKRKRLNDDDDDEDEPRRKKSKRRDDDEDEIDDD